MNRIHAMQDDPIALQAGAWLLELQSPDVAVERIAEWLQWMAADESHRRAYQEAQRTWQRLDHLASGSPAWPEDAEVQADAYAPAVSISAWQALAERKQRRRPVSFFTRFPASARVKGLLAAAIALLAIGAWFALPLLSSGNLMVQTIIGENRQLRLPDNSRVFVGADSRLKISMKADSRDIVLEHGEAYFEVTKDPARPFRVRADTARITALGTAFNVRRTDTQVVVTVSDGAVKVEDERTHAVLSSSLEVGQRLTLPAANQVPAIEAVAPATVASWREGQLQFSDEPLSGVIADINRYTTRPIRIDDPTIADLRLTGTVSTGNIESWLKSLEKALPVSVVTDREGAVGIVAR